MCLSMVHRCEYICTQPHTLDPDRTTRTRATVPSHGIDEAAQEMIDAPPLPRPSHTIAQDVIHEMPQRCVCDDQCTTVLLPDRVAAVEVSRGQYHVHAKSKAET